MLRPASSERGKLVSTARFPGQVAQLVEQRIENPRVGGSIPSLATISFPSIGKLSPFAAV
jgi:hypothetical protein